MTPDDQPSQLPLDLALHPHLRREDFIAGASNGAALAMIESWPNWPDGMLAIHGPAGCGKSHLCAVWSGPRHARQVSPQNIQDLLATLDPEGCYLLDCNDPAEFDQDALFHLFNHVRLSPGASMLFAGQDAPARWPVTLPDLRSRLSSVTAVALEMPDEDLLRAVMEKLFRDRQILVDDKVLDYILLRMDRQFEALHEIVSRLDERALHDQRSITIPLAKEILEALESEAEPPLPHSY